MTRRRTVLELTLAALAAVGSVVSWLAAGRTVTVAPVLSATLRRDSV